ncbi:MAG: hypothetical protein ACI976_002129 [Aureispira sp.]|jgi:hypothetical protein
MDWNGWDDIFTCQKINEGAHRRFFLKELNENKCFDFEYTPEEGDNLIFELKWILTEGEGTLKKILKCHSPLLFLKKGSG